MRSQCEFYTAYKEEGETNKKQVETKKKAYEKAMQENLIKVEKEKKEQEAPKPQVKTEAQKKQQSASHTKREAEARNFKVHKE